MAQIKQRRDYIRECLSLRDATSADLAVLSPTGRPKRIAERMRRAGNALARMSEREIAPLREKPLRDLLQYCEKKIAGIEIDYKG